MIFDIDHKQNSLMLERVSVMHSAIRACMVGDRPRVHSAIHAATNGNRNLHCLGIGIGEGPFEQASEDGYSAGSGHAPVLCAYPPILSSYPILMYYCHKTSKADHLIKPPGHTNGRGNDTNQPLTPDVLILLARSLALSLPPPPTPGIGIAESTAECSMREGGRAARSAPFPNHRVLGGRGWRARGKKATHDVEGTYLAGRADGD